MIFFAATVVAYWSLLRKLTVCVSAEVRLAASTATAASIWSTAAVGAAVAYGSYDIAVILSFANFAVLRWLAPFKSSQDDAPPGSDNGR